MLILVLLAPNIFSINPNIDLNSINKNISAVEKSLTYINSDLLNNYEKRALDDTKRSLSYIKENINSTQNIDKLQLRKEILSLKSNINSLNKTIFDNTSNLYMVSVVNSDLNNVEVNKSLYNSDITSILSIINYAPVWIIFLISISLGLGTMI